MPANHAAGTAGILSQSELDRDLAAVEGTFGWANLSGAVTFSAGYVFNVAAINAGDYIVNGTVGAAYVAATVTVTTADATNPRVDIVVVTSAGAVSVVAGTPAALTSTAGPVPPTPTASQLEIARIYVPTNNTPAMSATSITDRRTPLAHAAIPEYLDTMLPIETTVTYAVRTANTMYLIPIRPLTARVSVTAINWAHNVASGNYDVGIYSWDGTTMTAVVRKGSTASPAIGAARVSSTVTATTLYPGVRYFLAWAADNATEAVSIQNAGPVEMTGGSLGLSKATSFPLPATAITLAQNPPTILFGVVSGGAAI